MEDRRCYMAGMLFGAVIGFVAGVLLAPASGRETREKIAEKGREIAGDIRERRDEVTEAVRSKTKEIIKKLRERLPMTREISDVLEQVEKEEPGAV